jgi:hypothetical protein
MHTDNGLGATFQLGEVTASGDQLVLQGTVRLEMHVPPQDERLPYEVEQAVEDAGQRFKRWVFCQLMEQLDAELVLAGRQGKDGQGVVCRGCRPMAFKTVFGTVRVRRRRVEQKADGAVEIPSAKAWRTPRQVTITQGLQDAVCDAMLQESSRKSLRHVEERAGEPGLLARVTVLNLVHEEGGVLREAARRRAEAVFAADPQAARCLLPSPPESPPDEETPPPELPEVGESGFEPLQGFPGAPGAEAVDLEQPRRVDPDTVMVQADEVVVHAQASTGMKQIKVYTAMVRTAARSWYFAEENAQALIYLVGAILAVLGVHQGQRRLLFVNDGARWIRDWFESLPVKAKTMVLCWYHMAKRSLSCLYMACHGRKHREAVYGELMGHLWEGRVDEALAALARRREEMKCRVALKELVEYLQNRRPYLPNYRARREAGLWIASNRVEKLNDWAVSQRCKGLGMDWTREGVLALAVLESARRNGELPSWRRSRSLPVWVDKAPEAQAA